MQTSVALRSSFARASAVLLLAVVLVFAAFTAAFATESQGEAPGVAPREANDEGNDFAPKNYEQNFLWGAAVGLGALTLGGVGALGGLYWLLVQRPAQQAAASEQG